MSGALTFHILSMPTFTTLHCTTSLCRHDLHECIVRRFVRVRCTSFDRNLHSRMLGSPACSFQAPGCSLLLPVGTVNSVHILKVEDGLCAVSGLEHRGSRAVVQAEPVVGRQAGVRPHFVLCCLEPVVGRQAGVRPLFVLCCLCFVRVSDGTHIC
jgi:hypothetical protein